MSDDRNRLVHTYLPAIASAVIGGIFVLVAAFLQSRGSIPEVVPLPETTRTATVTTTATVTARPSGSATTGSDSQNYDLSELSPIELVKEGRSGGCTGGCTGFEADAGRIGPTVYPRSWLLGVDADGARSSITFNSSNACTELNGRVGLSDDSPRTEVTVSVEKDGSSPEEVATAPLGEAREVSLDLRDVATFTLSAYLSGPSVEDATAVLGDMVLTCRAGSQDPF